MEVTPKFSLDLEWPELVGLTPEEAEKKIKEEIPTKGSDLTMDFNQGRVRSFLDPSGKVQRPPN
ncbi:Proteinase inhibitor I13, potato inhibitor I, partial [Corchorus capsularis]